MKNQPSSLGGPLRKLVYYVLLGLFSLYVLGVAGAYSWLHFVRKNQQIGLFDVALFRVFEVRRSIAAQHFAQAQVEWDAKNYQAAYLYFSAAVHQDPDNVPGRLAAVRFLRSVGAGNLGLTMLEEGLARTPDDLRLITPTFEFLLAAGRDRHALDLLRQRYGSGLSGPNGALLQRYELEATLTAEGAPAAKQLLERHPGLLQDPLAAPVLAHVLWESQERLRAISLLQKYLQGQPGVYADFAQLARWQEAGGLAADAVQTARHACDRFSRELSPRVLLIEMLAAETPGGPAIAQAITAYVRDFADQPEGLAELAALAGQKGWVDLNRALYEIGANHQSDLNVLALSYCDALARALRFKEVQQILTQLEAQAPNGSAAFMVQLRQRQVIAAAALGDSDNVREYARRLAALLGRDPDGLEVCRRLFKKLKITEAVAELSSRSLAVSATAGK